jgi:osmotically-inducible protein OsmY
MRLFTSIGSVAVVAAVQLMAGGCAERHMVTSGTPGPVYNAALTSMFGQDYLAREVHYALDQLPYYGVFDNIEHQVAGRTVTLRGQVRHAALKDDATSLVSYIDGVEHVDNRIGVLPSSVADNHIRLALFSAIYSAPRLDRYALEPTPPIRLVVDSGRVTLAGAVGSEGDKRVAGLRARGTPGVSSVTNQLRVMP